MKKLTGGQKAVLDFFYEKGYRRDRLLKVLEEYHRLCCYFVEKGLTYDVKYVRKSYFWGQKSSKDIFDMLYTQCLDDQLFSTEIHKLFFLHFKALYDKRYRESVDSLLTLHEKYGQNIKNITCFYDFDVPLKYIGAEQKVVKSVLFYQKNDLQLSHSMIKYFYTVVGDLHTPNLSKVLGVL